MTDPLNPTSLPAVLHRRRNQTQALVLREQLGDLSRLVRRQQQQDTRRDGEG